MVTTRSTGRTLGRRSRSELDDLLVGMVGALIASEPLDARAIARGTSLRVIARSGVGYDSVDLEAATHHGVAVCNAPGTNSTAVAELTLTAMLMCARRVLEIVDGVRDGGWPRHDGHDLHGKVLGIIGFGPAGRRVAELALSLRADSSGAHPLGRIRRLRGGLSLSVSPNCLCGRTTSLCTAKQMRQTVV